MRTFMKVTLIPALILSLSGAVYAQGAGAGGATGGAGGGTAGGSAGQGGTGMGTPNASGVTGSMSGASGSSKMGTGANSTQKQMKQKKGPMDSPASDSGMKKAY
ncbi:hypothetical protein P0D72_07710 [Paraburkholderia sediminicola]|uniref:hypothetical protein n=1 Tax=Paraburkholderia sediminicola TaxID=458836 RepID=UPI0038B7B7E8